MACFLTNHKYEGGGSWMPHTTVDSSGGGVGLIQQNTDEERCLHENPSEMLTKAALLLLYPAAQVLWLDCHVAVFNSCGLHCSGWLSLEPHPEVYPQ